MSNQKNTYEVIKFEDGEFSLDVNVSPTEETVWISANQMALLFERDEKTIRKHINNVFKDNEIEIIIHQPSWWFCLFGHSPRLLAAPTSAICNPPSASFTCYP